MGRMDIFSLIDRERDHQQKKWGDKHDNRHSLHDFLAFITVQMGKVVKCSDAYEIRQAFINIAALCVASIEWMERKGFFAPVNEASTSPDTGSEPLN
jgi:hypothetical protein